jgi:hypothetical protein
MKCFTLLHPSAEDANPLDDSPDELGPDLARHTKLDAAQGRDAYQRVRRDGL